MSETNEEEFDPCRYMDDLSPDEDYFRWAQLGERDLDELRAMSTDLVYWKEADNEAQERTPCVSMHGLLCLISAMGNRAGDKFTSADSGVFQLLQFVEKAHSLRGLEVYHGTMPVYTHRHFGFSFPVPCVYPAHSDCEACGTPITLRMALGRKYPTMRTLKPKASFPVMLCLGCLFPILANKQDLSPLDPLRAVHICAQLEEGRG